MSESKSSLGVRNRRKGHTLERNVAKLFRDLGFERACTTREGSRLMDNAKLDVCYVPFNVQCKAVEAHIDYQALTEEVRNGVKTLVPEREKFPIMIFHKRKRKINVILSLDEFKKLIKMYGVSTELH
jgi:hypothetical protein